MNGMFDILYTEAAIQILCNFVEIALRHGCPPVNLLHILRTPFFKNTSGWLLLFRIWLSVKFSTDMINSTREKIEFSCTNCFRSTVLLVFALATALNKFCFRSLRNKWSIYVWWLSITLIFVCSLTSIKKCIFQGFTEILLNLVE